MTSSTTWPPRGNNKNQQARWIDTQLNDPKSMGWTIGRIQNACQEGAHPQPLMEEYTWCWLYRVNRRMVDGFAPLGAYVRADWATPAQLD